MWNKMSLKNLLLLFLLVLLFGCGETRVDTSSYETLVKSLGKIRVSLPDSKKKEFDEYSMLMAFYEVDLKNLANGDGVEKLKDAKINATLNGKSGEEILAEGPKYKSDLELMNREKLKQEYNKIAKKKNEFIMAKKMITVFKVVRSRLFKEKASGSDAMVPILEMNVKNGTDQAVYKVHFDWEVSNPNNGESKGERGLIYEIPEGFQPNDAAVWKITSKITDLEISPELKLKINITQLDDKNGEPLFGGNKLTEKEEERLAELKSILQMQK